MQSKPIFNKRLYKAQAGITISKQAKDVLLRKATETRSESDLHAIRSVVTGLKVIHKNFEFVKAALGCAITYENHESETRIEKTGDESELSCFYILAGSVEAFYKVKNVATGDTEDCTISYTHVAGDYVGLVSADGPRFDLPSPERMTTIEHSEFIRIDRKVFHEKIQEEQRQFQNEITRFLDSYQMFEKLTQEDRHKLISQMAKQEFPAGKQILSQGKKQEHAFFIAEGRCQYYRRVYLPDQKRSELFKMGYVEKGSYFDPSCILDNQESKFSVIAVGSVTCYLLNKWTIKNSESLLRALSLNRPSFQSDKHIEYLIKESDQWQSYKRDMACNTMVFSHKLTRIVPQDHVPRTLNRAIRSGTALRQRRQQQLSHYSRDELDPSYGKPLKHPQPPEEETVPDNTKSILKAIMLMRRSRGSIHNHTEEEMKKLSKVYPEPKNNKDRLLKSREKHTRSMYKNSKLENKRDGQEEDIKRKISIEKSVFDVSKRIESPEVKSDNNKATSKPRVMEDHWVTAKERKFVVKEVLNTRIPGRSYSDPQTYRRFEPSMFQSLDMINSFQKKKVTDPFSAKVAATAWLKKIMERSTAGQHDYNPGPSPVIVIEELCEDDILNDVNEETGDETQSKNKVKAKTCKPNLETLIEDSDKENIAENSPKDEWSTPVHETKYESERCLEKTKQEIAELEQRLVKLGWSREMLLAKDKKAREERRKRGSKSEENKIEASQLDKMGKENNAIKNDKKRRTLRREDSIQKILEGRSLKRTRSNSKDNNADTTRHPSITTHHSASSLQPTRALQERGLRKRAASIL